MENKAEVQSVDMDALFGTKQPTDSTHPTEAPLAHEYTESERNGASILNALFNDAAPSEGWDTQNIDAADGDEKNEESSNLPAKSTQDDMVNDRSVSEEPTNEWTDKSTAETALSVSERKTAPESTEQGTMSATEPAPSERPTPSVGTTSISLDTLFAGASKAPEPAADAGDTHKAVSEVHDEQTDKSEKEQEASKEEGPKSASDTNKEDQGLQPVLDTAEEGLAKDDAERVGQTDQAPNQEDEKAREHEQPQALDQPNVESPQTSVPHKDTASDANAKNTSKPNDTQNLLSFLTSGKAPERLAAKNKHLSRMEFVQTMVTLLYVRMLWRLTGIQTDSEYVDQLYATYLAEQN